MNYANILPNPFVKTDSAFIARLKKITTETAKRKTARNSKALVGRHVRGEQVAS